MDVYIYIYVCMYVPGARLRSYSKVIKEENAQDPSRQMNASPIFAGFGLVLNLTTQIHIALTHTYL